MTTYTYTVTVTAATRDEANTVMVERVFHDEDYGFEYTIDVDWDRTVETI